MYLALPHRINTRDQQRHPSVALDDPHRYPRTALSFAVNQSLKLLSEIGVAESELDATADRVSSCHRRQGLFPLKGANFERITFERASDRKIDTHEQTLAPDRTFSLCEVNRNR